MNRFFLIVYCSLLALHELGAQNKYFIGFTDKSSTPFSTSNPQAFLTQASIDRRIRYCIALNVSDLPVDPNYTKQVANVDAVRVLYPIKWLNGVVISFTDPAKEDAGLQAIQALPFVKSNAKVRRLRRSVDPVIPLGQREKTYERRKGQGGFNYGGSDTQIRQLHLDCLHEQGFRGEGIVIGVMDVGFQTTPKNIVFDSLRAQKRILGTRDFVDGGFNVYRGGDHGTMVLSCMAACAPGLAMGTAPKASYWLFRTEEGAAETISEEYNWIRAAEFADSVGVDVFNTSLGYTDFNDASTTHEPEERNGRNAPMSIAATMAARKGILVVNSAGNDGDDPNTAWRKISIPADADSIIAVGAVDKTGARASFSSIGPTADNRIKPDLAAMGDGAWVCADSAVCFPGSGTSFSGPVLAGAVACYWQAHRRLNNIGVINELKSGATQHDIPDNFVGWGIPNVCTTAPGGYYCSMTSGVFDFHAYASKDAVFVQLVEADYEYVNYEVFDALGKKLFELQTYGNDLAPKLVTDPLASGVYLVRVTSSLGTKTIKILKLDL